MKDTMKRRERSLLNHLPVGKRRKMMEERGKLGEEIGIGEELIKRACSAAMKAHESPAKFYLYDKIRSSQEVVVFAFAGSWSAIDLFKSKPFGLTEINLDLFPSLKSIGNNETAKVNQAFLERFEAILNTSLKYKVEKAMRKGKQIVFAGHSSGGPMAILTTIWFLHKYRIKEGIQFPHRCLTFGSLLTGDQIMGHALRRENWAGYFIHFVNKYDIVPRIMLAPLSSVEGELQMVLNSFKNFINGSFLIPAGAPAFFKNIMRNASAVASHAACNLMGCVNMLLDSFLSFVELSPYKPFGTYIFCSGNGQLVVVKNPDAVLQMLFYCCQLNNEAELVEVASRSSMEHMCYEIELQDSLQMQNVVNLNHLENLPLSSDGDTLDEVNMALNDLGLSSRARLCLRAAGELEKQKKKNQNKIDSNKDNIAKGLSMIREYQKACEMKKVYYYDAFKLQADAKDFEANVKRLELAGIWDEIIEMLKRNELPDGFEGRKEWIELGTKFRRLVEPLDIANYYRHLKNDDTGPYLKDARPKRYRYTQRWHEHAEKMEVGSSSESCFLAEVEELRSKHVSSFGNMEKIAGLEKDILKWVCANELDTDVFLDGSTFANWWKTLPSQYKSESCLSGRLSS